MITDEAVSGRLSWHSVVSLSVVVVDVIRPLGREPTELYPKKPFNLKHSHHLTTPAQRRRPQDAPSLVSGIPVASYARARAIGASLVVTTLFALRAALTISRKPVSDWAVSQPVMLRGERARR